MWDLNKNINKKSNILKKIKDLVSKRERSELKLSVGEEVRDYMIKAGLESVENAAYISGNNTERVLKIAETAKAGLETAGGAVGGVELGGALGEIAYKTTRDIARGGYSLHRTLCYIRCMSNCCSLLFGSQNYPIPRSNLYRSENFK